MQRVRVKKYWWFECHALVKVNYKGHSPKVIVVEQPNVRTPKQANFLVVRTDHFYAELIEDFGA